MVSDELKIWVEENDVDNYSLIISKYRELLEKGE
jgi:hypothetical protein